MIAIELGTDIEDIILPISLFMIFASTIVQGGSAPIIGYLLRTRHEKELLKEMSDLPLVSYGTTESCEPLRFRNSEAN
jgi:NhaP-type Na+/H+ or K+/H+ antiporter